MWSSTDRLIAFLIWIRHQVLVSLVVFIIISTVISLSISVYSAFYFFYIPTHKFTSEPLNFLFTPCNVGTQNEKGYTKCSFPTATVILQDYYTEDDTTDSRNFFLPNQQYTLQLHLNLALSSSIHTTRMFVVCLELLDVNDNHVSNSETYGDNRERCVTSTMPSKSVFARLVDFLFRYPVQAICNIFEQSSLCVGLAMTTELNYWSKITFDEKFEGFSHNSIGKAVITIKDIYVEPLEATFHIHEANLLLWKDPILYLITNHSNLTCLITVLTITIPVLILILMGWDRLTKPRTIITFKDPNINCNDSSKTAAPKSSSKSDDMSSRYDQARQRLKACKANFKSKAQNFERNVHLDTIVSDNYPNGSDAKGYNELFNRPITTEHVDGTTLSQSADLTGTENTIRDMGVQSYSLHKSSQQMTSTSDSDFSSALTKGYDSLDKPEKSDTCIRRKKET